jgi:hypothetical protein
MVFISRAARIPSLARDVVGPSFHFTKGTNLTVGTVVMTKGAFTLRHAQIQERANTKKSDFVDYMRPLTMGKAAGQLDWVSQLPVERPGLPSSESWDKPQ